MGAQKQDQYDVKLPSDCAKVTPDNLWAYCIAIAKTGKSFEEKDLLKSNPPHNVHDSIRRNLAYLKYLGFLVENREKRVINGKKEPIQRFIRNESDELVKDFFYLLASNRRDEAKKVWSRVLGKHSLYQGVYNLLLKDQGFATVIDLADVLRKQDGGGSNPAYYKNGAIFVAGLLDDAGLLKFNRTESRIESIVPADNGPQITNPPIETIPFSQPELVGTAEGFDKGELYLVAIRGADINFTFKVREVSDLSDVRTILDIVQKKLKKEGAR